MNASRRREGPLPETMRVLPCRAGIGEDVLLISISSARMEDTFEKHTLHDPKGASGAIGPDSSFCDQRASLKTFEAVGPC